MDEEGQKYKVACCSDRYTENRDKQFCTQGQYQKGYSRADHLQTISLYKNIMNSM